MEGRYHAVKGSVVFEDKAGHRSTVLGVECSTDGGETPDSYPIGVDSTDPGLTTFTNVTQWTRGVFPGRPDLLMCTPLGSSEPQVIWVEVKTNWSDFDSSRRSKRLAREVSTGLHKADRVVVAFPSSSLGMPSLENYLEILRLQSLGVLVVPWVASFKYWDDIRRVLGGVSNQRRALAGSDYHKARTALSGFPGVGPKTEAKLLAKYGDAHTALLMYPEGWIAPLSMKQVTRIEKACREQKG